MHANPVTEKTIDFARLFGKHSPNPHLSTIENPHFMCYNTSAEIIYIVKGDRNI